MSVFANREHPRFMAMSLTFGGWAAVEEEECNCWCGGGGGAFLVIYKAGEWAYCVCMCIQRLFPFNPFV